MSVTMREVARQAGVSVATVSRVLNGSGPVGATTRARIESVARAMRYVPNRTARSLSTSRTHTFGVVLPDIYGDFFSELLRGMDGATRRHQYHLLMAGAHGGAEALASALKSMSGRVDGLVVMSPDVRADVLEANLPSRLPAVVLGERVAGFAALQVDNEGGAAAMTEHLVGLGHRRIAHVAGAERNRDAAERLAGYLAVMHASGLPTAGLVERGDFTEESGHAAARRLIGGSVRPDVIFAANDSMAVGAMGALRDAGLRVPDDVGVAGFDDIPLSRYFSPPITSVHVPIDELGRRAVEGLCAALEEGPGTPPVAELLATTLVVRASCGSTVLA